MDSDEGRNVCVNEYDQDCNVPEVVVDSSVGEYPECPAENEGNGGDMCGESVVFHG
jgi:hypothetical protein